MQINLLKLAQLEANLKLPKSTENGEVTKIGHSETFTFILDAIRKFYETPVEDVEHLESFFPIYDNLQELGIVTNAPEMEDITEEDDENPEEEEE